MKKSLILAILLFLSVFSYAQKSYKEGFIIQLNGDTLKGSINYRNWGKNPKTIEFKSLNDIVTKYDPKEITAFAVLLANGLEFYKSAKVEIETSSEHLDQLDKTDVFNTKTETLFLLRIYKGQYSLFNYYDHKDHYLIETGNKINELLFKSFLVQEKKIIKIEKYKQQLQLLFTNCKSITENDINALTYDDLPLIKLLKKYDACMGLTPENNQNSERPKFVYRAILGGDYSNLSIKSKLIRNVSLSNLGNLSAGFSIGLVLPRNNKSSSFNLDFVFRKYNFSGTGFKHVSDNNDNFYTYDIKGSHIKMNVMYRYQWTLVKLKPFINFGLTQAVGLDLKDKSKIDYHFFNTVTTKKLEVLSDRKNYEGGFSLGTGIDLKRISIELRAEISKRESANYAANAIMKSAFLNLNYIF